MSSQHQHSHQQQQHVINMTGLDSGPVTTTGLGGGVAAASGSGRLGTPGMASGSSTTNSASSSTTTHIPPGAYRSTSSQRSPHLHQSAYAPLSPTHNSSYMSPSLTSLSPISATSASTSQLGRSQSLGHAAYQQMQTASYNHSPSSSTAATLYPQQPLEAAPYRTRQPSSSEGGGALLPTINSHINRNPQPPTMQQQQQQMYSPGMRHSMVIDSHGYNAATGPPKSPLHRTQGGSSPYANSRPVSMYDMSYGLQPTSSPHHTMSPHHQTLSPRSSQQAQLHTDRSGGMLPTHVGPSGSGGDSLPMYSNNATGLLPTNSPYSSSSVQYTGAPPRTAAGAYEPSQMMEAGPSNHRERRGTLTSADVGMGDYAAWERQKQMGSSAAEMRAPAHPPPRLLEGFRRVRDLSDLKAVNEPAQAGIGRRADPSGGYVSPLKAMTSYLHHTYHLVNPAFFYELSFNPRRVLTKPSRPVHNDGHDNEDSDYILYVNDWLGAEEGNRYLILDVLGQGTFGQVVKCQNMKTREIVAVKVIKNKPAYFNQSMMEVTILEMLNNNWDPDDQHHILRLRDTFIHAKHLCLVFELLSSNLYELIKQNSFKGLSTSLVRVFTTQLLDALTVLHEARLIHCDLKPENILLKTLQTPSIKLVDFGSACHERQTVYTYIQSRFYRSPEVLLGLPYNASIDMWSLGCIAVELFLGLPLFPGTSEYNQVCRIVEMLGLPPAFMLEGGKQTGEFFNVYTDDYNRRSYKLKSLEQYSQEHNVDEQPSKRYFQATTLPDIIKTYPLARKSGKPADVQKEMANRNSFIDFVSGLLNMDPAKRWTPQQAKLHPFITGEKLAAPFKPPASPVTTLTRSKSTSAALNSTADSSRHPYGGLPQTPSRSSGRAYHDAAAYNQHLAQQQAYNSAHQARQNQPPMINNPYAQDEIRNQAAEASAAKAAAAAKTQAQVQVAQAQAQAHAHAQAQAQAHAQAQTHSAQMQAARSSPYGQPGNVSTAAAAASTYAVQQQQNSRSRSNTITRMDLVPGQLAKMGIDSGHSMTPVMSREESMREWERRQRNGRNDYQHLDSLQQQADLSQSAFSSPTGQQQQQSWSQLPGSSGQPYRMGTSTTSPSNSMMQPAQSFSVIVDAHQQQNRHASPSMQQQHHQSMTSPSRMPAGSAVPPPAGAYTNNASNARYQPMMGGQGSSNNASIAAFDPYNSDIAQLMPALQPTQYQGGAASHRNSMAGGSGQPQQHPAMTASASLSTSIYGSPVGGPISPTSPNHRSLEEGFVSPQQRQTQSPAHYQLPTASQGGRMRYG